MVALRVVGIDFKDGGYGHNRKHIKLKLPKVQALPGAAKTKNTNLGSISYCSLNPFRKIRVYIARDPTAAPASLLL
jgi:hypothetical protein